MQAATPYNPNIPIVENRHKIFIQQCKELMQIIDWLNSGEIVDGSIIGVEYESGEFSPNLDSPLDFTENS